jgi:predicted branched-subunit amino acid permease
MVATSLWGFVTGIAMVKSGMSDLMAALMTLLVYAGSAQLTALPLIMAGAPVWLIFAAACVVNIRFVIFGAALQPYFRRYPFLKRLGLGYWLSDMVFVLFLTRYGDARHRGTRDQLWYYLGVIIPGWISWQIASLAGVFMGGVIPPSWSVEFAATLALLAITVPLVKSRPMAMSVVVAGCIAWLGQPLPLRLGLAAAVVGGIVAGVTTEKRLDKRKRHA